MNETTLRSKPFQLLLKPVGSACNLSCAYCFYRGSTHPAGRDVMSPKVLESAIAALLGRRQELSVFSWQGGEPTLAGLRFFREVVRFQARIGSQGQAVGNALQTNGLLIDRAWADFLQRYRFQVGISLDGPMVVHDRYRRTARDAGSHAGALAAARLLRERGVAVAILAAVTRGVRADEIYPWLREQGFDVLQFIPVVERSDSGGMTPFSVEPQEWGIFLSQMFDLWWPERHRVEVREFSALAARLAGGTTGLCVLEDACDAYLVVEADGSVYPCDFFVRREWLLGNVRRQSLDALAATPLALSFARGKSVTHDSCGACPWLPLCQGGCQKDRERAKDQEGRSWLCSGLRMFFSHALPRLGLTI